MGEPAMTAADFGSCLASLHRIVRCLAPRPQFRNVLKSVLEILSDDLSFERPHIVVQNPENGRLHLSMSLDRPVEHITYAPGTGVTGQVFSSGEPVIVPRMSEHPDFMNKLFARPQYVLEQRSFICVPIFAESSAASDEKRQRNPVGVLSADTPCADPSVLQMRCRLLEIVASLVGHQAACLQEEMLRKSTHSTALDEKPLPKAMRDIPSIVAFSQSMNHVLHHAAQAAPSPTTILLRGETGTGKELMALAIHQCSLRADKPFIKLNCAALPAELVEGELFGWQKGAFSGAQQNHRGMFEQADGGSLFLDEIGDLSLSAQAKVLRAIQEREISRLGSEKTIKVDVRLICATHQPLEQLVDKGMFREDLYYRINVFPLFLPPLRERTDDILPLAEFFLQQFSANCMKSGLHISRQASDLLKAYRWPGNVRELQNTIERAVLLCEEHAVLPVHLPPEIRGRAPEERSADKTSAFAEEIRLLEKKRLEEALALSGGNIHKAARNIKITYRVFYYKLKKYGIDYRSFIPK